MEVAGENASETWSSDSLISTPSTFLARAPQGLEPAKAISQTVDEGVGAFRGCLALERSEHGIDPRRCCSARRRLGRDQ